MIFQQNNTICHTECRFLFYEFCSFANTYYALILSLYKSYTHRFLSGFKYLNVYIIKNLSVVRKTQTNLDVFISHSPHSLAFISVSAQYFTYISSIIPHNQILALLTILSSVFFSSSAMHLDLGELIHSCSYNDLKWLPNLYSISTISLNSHFRLSNGHLYLRVMQQTLILSLPASLCLAAFLSLSLFFFPVRYFNCNKTTVSFLLDFSPSYFPLHRFHWNGCGILDSS